ncbi:hypothetical protein [Streptomyces avidinii]
MADGKQTAEVDRPDSAVGGVKIQQIKGDLFVVPDEAVPLLGADRLDRRLFNVTDLIEMGYDDAKSAAVPLIATYARTRSGAVVEPTAPRGSRLTRSLKNIGGAALSTEKGQARTFWSSLAPQGGTALGAGVAKLWLDGRVKASLKERAVDRRARGLGRPATPARGSRSRCSTPGSTSTTPTSPA